MCPDLDRITFAHDMHTSAHTVKVEQISHKTGTLWQCEINQREQGRVFLKKKKFQDLHVGSLLGRLHGLLQNTADTETVDTTEDIGTLCDRHISTSIDT